MTTAAIGDYCDDKRIEGFTEVFEAGGGEVVYVAHSGDPSEATQKTNDAVTANENVDCIYGFGDGGYCRTEKYGLQSIRFFD